MTHQQLVEEWKRKLQEYYRKYLNGTVKTVPERLEEFFEQAMLASAKGAAEAARMKAQRKWGTDGDIIHAEKDNWNAAISQSERQLEDYFSGA